MRLVTVMTFVWPAVGLALPLIGFWLISGPGKYKRIFSDDHLLEVWSDVRRVKAIAIEALGEPSSAGDQGSIDAAISRGQRFTTSAGMTFIYTIDREGDGYHHHISMSDPRVLAMAAATYFAVFLGEILSIDVRDATLQSSSRLVCHLSFELDESNEQKFAAQPVAPPDAQMLPEIRKRVLAIKRQLRVVRLAG